jgi:tetratricopeptide (TPR) repeat protein
VEDIKLFTELAPYLTQPLVLIGFVLLLAFGVHRALIKSGIIPPVGPRTGGRIVQAILRYGFWLAVLVIVLGFSLKAFEIHRTSQPTVDVTAIVESYAASQRALGQTEAELADAKQQLEAAVIELARLRDAADAPPSIDKALEHIAEGETAEAEEIFQVIAQRHEKDIKETAAAYRHLGALAFLTDTQKAFDAYRRATELDPENPDGWNQLGQLLKRTGQIDEAFAASRRVETIGEQKGDKEILAVAYGNLGNLYQTRGELDQAKYKKNNRHHPCISRQKTRGWIGLNHPSIRPQSVQSTGFSVESAHFHGLSGLPA